VLRGINLAPRTWGKLVQSDTLEKDYLRDLKPAELDGEQMLDKIRQLTLPAST
jgi:hypothetical protein